MVPGRIRGTWTEGMLGGTAQQGKDRAKNTWKDL